MLVCRIKFKEAGKKYYFSVNDLQLEDGSAVVVETARGIELGYVTGELCECPAEVKTEIKPVLRIATEQDIEKFEKNLIAAKEITPTILECIQRNDVDFKFLDAEYTLDKQKLMIYFQSESRIDFRALVKDLADVFKTRIELRQVGLREGAKMFGGIGPCGLIVCCKKWIGDFENVSIKMAKNQNLSLNPQKISGLCSKLLCCINFENATYEEYRKGLPDLGDIVKTDDGDVKIMNVDVLRQRFKGKNFSTDAFVDLTLEDIKGFKKYNNEKK